MHIMCPEEHPKVPPKERPRWNQSDISPQAFIDKVYEMTGEGEDRLGLISNMKYLARFIGSMSKAGMDTLGKGEVMSYLSEEEMQELYEPIKENCVAMIRWVELFDEILRRHFGKKQKINDAVV